MEDKHEEVEDIESGLSDSFIDDDDSDNDDDNEPSTSGQDDGTRIQEPLTDQEVEELVAEFLEVESKAAEAQEALEKESLAKVESDVREELAQSLQGDDLEAAVEDEMATFREEWENVLDELETESYHLLEQLDGTGIELPSLYKWIESQAPNSCCTEAWKSRAHWVGTQVTKETTDTVADAEKYLQIHRPVRRRHGKLLEEGASGFLQKKLAMDGSEAIAENGEVDWASMKKLFSTSSSEDVASFGSKHWASVYLANTPQEAALMGLKFPGVNEVEEIEDIDGNSTDPFVAEAIANEKELVLSEEQRKNYRKVKEEDDAKIDQKLQLRLKQRRCLKRCKQGVSSVVQEMGTNMAESVPLDDNYHEVKDLKKDVCENSGDLDMEQLMSESNSVFPESDASEPRSSKRSNESEDLNINNKKIRTVIIDSDNEADILEDKSVQGIKIEDQSTLLENIGDPSAGCNPSQGSSEKFQCTACDKVAVEVHSHPLLKVIVCKDCKFLMEEKMHVKDPDCSECYCGWCGRNNDLVSCKSCRTLFCTACIKRNIGEEYLYKDAVSGWQCCCCSPSLLQRLTSQLEKAMGSGDIMVSSSDSDSDSSDTNDDVTISSKRKKKKKIRRIIDDAELGEETKRKIAIEKERQERLKSLKVKFSDKSKMMKFASCSGNLPEGASVEVIGDATTGYIVNVAREKGEEAVRIPPSLSSKLKAHQVAGIRFLWENIIQSIRKVKSGDNGLGCILAHTMGLGKTFQVIAFLYTAMRSVDLGLRTALIVTPVNVLHNWRKEFMKWTPSEVKPLRVFMLEDVSRERRVELLAKWRAKGGVFLIGYSAFRNLSLGKNVKERNMAREMCNALQDGPDILVCDEAHIIKNTRAETTQALKLVKCQRRIALTGSPLQNNLMEYYCMVDFVREGFLGSSHEFRNRFQNPIENGQHTNSTVDDVKIMNQRSHILYEQLKGFVQRMDMSVVKKDLPPKTVFVVAVKLSPLQRKLYKRFLDVHGFTNGRVSNEKMRKSFFAGYQALAQIWNHPGILQLRKGREYVGNVENFLADDCSSDENVDYNTIVEEKSRNPNDFIQGKSDDGFFQKDWWNDLLLENNYKEVDYSGKMVLLLDILVMSSDVGDKTLVFTQSIPTLDLIELYLSRLPRVGKKGKFWRKGKDWYRLDGRTESSERQRLVERFNDPENKRVKCTLISTRAGSLGINLYAANRVVIVDGSWNPTYDLQAIYRAWRYGQTKPVFAYRLMAHGTMEEKIYKRQVTKEGLAARVVDRQQVYRTISREEMLHLFEFGDDENSDTLIDIGQEYRQADTRNISCQTANSLKKNASRSHGSCASGKVMESLLGKHRQRWIFDYHEHETLLQENEEEKLTKEEQDMAWEVYKRSLEWEEVHRVSLDDSTFERKPPMSNGASSAPDASSIPVPSMARPASEASNGAPSESILRSRMVQRKCTNLSHLLTLRSQGTKAGCTTICGECAQEISWEDLKREGKAAREGGCTEIMGFWDGCR
ncbi:PREDICTED: protein CHROMATIN REMODELING 20-like isoform X2 [Populus euphratica]|uniref:ATP-dependent helicase ATRX n=1 Tax=Populus euphratica TaxID=75702 RepID=A0AAJ6UZX1_POPEU|nr:PREDICTED: protein CHROMATIN REMODELING 20-like isoform X2 [Populus euphratica]